MTDQKDIDRLTDRGEVGMSHYDDMECKTCGTNLMKNRFHNVDTCVLSTQIKQISNNIESAAFKDDLQNISVKVAELEQELAQCLDVHAKLNDEKERLLKIIFPCETCDGTGELDDAGFGDISFNKWICPDCNGFNVKREKEALEEPLQIQIKRKENPLSDSVAEYYMTRCEKYQERNAELEQELAEERESNEAFSVRIEELAATLEHVNNRYKEQGKQAMRLRDALEAIAGDLFEEWELRQVAKKALEES